MPPIWVFILALCSVIVLGILDYLAGYETSLSLFYLAPVAVASWYTGRRGAIAIAIIASLIWLTADVASGHNYGHPLTTLWELLVRIGMFLVQGLLLVALHNALNRERKQLRHDLSLAQRQNTPITVVFLDVDDFKAVNDKFGHHEGDRVLRITGRILRDSTRNMDTVARLGGDEFVLVFPNTDMHGAEDVITKIRHDLRLALAVTTLPVTFSIGAITFPDAPLNMDEALKAADDLMYEAKRRGKDAAFFKVAPTRTNMPNTPGSPPTDLKLFRFTR